MGVIGNIIWYLRQPVTDEEMARPFLEEQRQLQEYKRLRKRLPKLIRRLEATARELREITQQ